MLALETSDGKRKSRISGCIGLTERSYSMSSHETGNMDSVAKSLCRKTKETMRPPMPTEYTVSRSVSKLFNASVRGVVLQCLSVLTKDFKAFSTLLPDAISTRPDCREMHSCKSTMQEL